MNKNKLIIICLLGLFMSSTFTGCLGSKRAVVVLPEPTCAEALSGGLHHLSDNDLTELLDEADGNDGLHDCWIPLMKASLDENRNLAHRHLAKAVKVFNQRRNEEYFHKAVYRYFSLLVKQPDRYRDEDRLLLESYCSYLINTAKTTGDHNLKQAKLICRRLDRNLYAKMFD